MLGTYEDENFGIVLVRVFCVGAFEELGGAACVAAVSAGAAAIRCEASEANRPIPDTV